MSALATQHTAPALSVFLTSGARWTLGERRPLHLTMVFFYRGHRCAYCERVLKELDRRYNEFLMRGVEVVCVSMDYFDQALQMVMRHKLFSLPIGFGLTHTQAEAWELELTRSASDDQIRISEPTIWLVTPEGDLYASYAGARTLALPTVDGILSMLDAFLQTKQLSTCEH